MAGMAIDVSILYLVKAQLVNRRGRRRSRSRRSLSRGADMLAEGKCSSDGQAYFNANFPNGHLLTKNKNFTADVDESQSKMRTVNVQASVDAPLYSCEILR